jgi:HK97 family phage portal protein
MSIFGDIRRQFVKMSGNAALWAFQTVATWEDGKPTYPLVNYNKIVTNGFRKNELIYSCISLKADSASSARMMSVDEEGMDNEEHGAILALRNPNPFYTEFDFYAMTLIMLDLAGRAYWEKVRNGLGEVIQLWPLRPDWVAPVKDKKQFISGYEYKVPGTDLAKELLPDDVLDFELHDPLDFYNSLPPATVASRIISVDNDTTDLLKNFFEHGAVPLGLLSSKQRLSDGVIADLRRRWGEHYGGWRNWIIPAVTDSDTTYQKMGLTFKEMGFDVLDARAEARICMVLRVPPILVNATVGLARSTFSNYGEARRAFWEDSLFPRFRLIRDELQRGLANDPGWDAPTIFEWDFSEVPALQEELNARWARATSAFNASAITRNMFFEQVGLPQQPDGDVYKVMNTTSIVDDEEEVTADDAGDGTGVNSASDEEAGGDEGMRALPAGNVKRIAAPIDAKVMERRKKFEARMKREMHHFLEGQKKRIIEHVKKGEAE